MNRKELRTLLLQHLHHIYFKTAVEIRAEIGVALERDALRREPAKTVVPSSYFSLLHDFFKLKRLGVPSIYTIYRELQQLEHAEYVESRVRQASLLGVRPGPNRKEWALSRWGVRLVRRGEEVPEEEHAEK